VLIDGIGVVLVERLDQFAPYHHIPTAHTLPEHAEIDVFVSEVVCKSKGVTRKGIAQDKSVFGIYDTIIIAVNIADVTRLQIRSGNANW